MKALTDLSDRIMNLSYLSLFLIAFLVLFFPMASLSAIYQHTTIDTTTATINKTERVCESGNESCRWMVMTDRLVMVNSDALFHFKFDSSDMQANLQEGEQYTFTHYGWRIPFFSMYPNIIEVTQ